MEEKVLVKSEKYNVTIFSIIIAIVGLLPFAIYFLVSLTPKYIRQDVKQYNGTVFGEIYGYWDNAAFILLAVFIIALVIAVIVFFGYRQVEMTVTNKRVFGHAKFGKRADLPLDSISAVGTSMMKGIAVTTASGAIKFKFIYSIL